MRFFFCLLITCVLFSTALADPFTSIEVDGVISDDWSQNDRVLDDSADYLPTDSGDFYHLWTTWSADSLYIGYSYLASSRSAHLLIDVGNNSGLSDISLITSYPLPLQYNGSIDFVVGQAHGPFNDPGTPDFLRVLSDSGDTEDISGLVNSAQTFSLQPPGRLPAWYQTEISIPWDVIYPDGMPVNAALKIVGVTADPASSFAVDDVTPTHVSILDIDGDGLLDPADAQVSGSVTMETAAPVTVQAFITDWAGGVPVLPISTSTSEGQSYSIGRLSAGHYDLVYSAPGYFSITENVTVVESQLITGQNVTLEKATVVAGALTLEMPELVTGSGNGYEFRAPDGSVMESADGLLPSQMNPSMEFEFYVEDSGTYSLVVWAENHLQTEFFIDVTAGVDQLDLAFDLQRAPLISGRVVFETGPGNPGVINLQNSAGDTLFATLEFTELATDYQFYAPRLGELVLVATADTYFDTQVVTTVTAGVDITDLEVSMPRLPQLDLAVEFADGPGNEGQLFISDIDTLDISGGAVPSLFLPEGDYQITADVPGYNLWSETITLVGANSIHTPDPISLLAVRADRLLLVDGEEIIEGISATVSIPELEFYSFTPINVVAAGTDNRFDLFDLDEKLNDLPLTARKMNDVMPPTGFARFLGSESLEDIISTVSFTNGAANFYMANDAVEVLRFFVGPEVPAERDPVPTGRFMIGFNDPRPESVLITTSNDTIQANGYSTITIGAQLYDSAGNETEIDNIPVSFLLSEGSSGTCQFAPVTVMTNADGYAETELSGILSGELYVSCSVTAYNRILEVFTVDEELSLNIVVIPGVAEQWDISSSASIAGSDSELGISAQLIDFFGNSVSQQGTEMNFTVDPPEMGNFQPMNAVSDATGYCETVFVPTGYAGLVNLGGISDYPVDSIALMLRDVLVLSDPAFNEEPEAHNTFEATDLTMVLLDNNPDGLFVDIPFSSNFDGLIFHLAIETGFNAEGATSDPFNMPVSYGHSDKPDFVLTSKHNWDGNYSDFRKWTSEWEWWDTASEAYIPTSGEWVESVMVQDRWVTRSDSGIAMRIPWGPFGGQPDSLKVELYITQEDGGDLRSALDSVPSDATLNIDFEPDSTDPADWATLTLPVTLSNWSEVYQVRTDFPTPPLITELSVTPDVLSAGMSFIVSAEVEDQGDGIGDVVVDLSGMAGPAIVRLAEVDGNYMLGSAVPLGSPGGTIEIIVNAYDESNRLASSSTVEVEVTAQVDVIVHVDDIIGDDHGPNQPGIEHKYYTYPTNSVFVPSAFDITALDIYRTTAAVSGQPINMVAFQVSIGDLPDPADSHTADWNPPYGELNIQKIDILIDTGAGGATSSLPNRRASFQAWNAWDFAIIMDGWYKALVPSYGNNTVEAWRENAMRSDSEIMIFGDVNSDYITALVAEDALGNPTDEDLASWSMAVLISSHDFGGEEVLGGIRWVNESSSEWNFGGGHFTDRDPNIIDLLLVPGEGKTVGRSQDYLLDYGTEEAVQRLNDGLTPCSIEMSAFEDTGPPSINIVRNNGEVISVDPLLNAPIAFTLEITDDYQVSGATFSYRSMSSGSQWDDTTDMGYVGNNLWSVDIPADWIDENLVYSPIDSTRYFEFQVTAVDAVEKESVSPVTTMQLSQSQSSLWFDANMGVEELSMRHIDGSGLKLDYRLLDEIVALYADEFGVTFSADSLATLMTLGWEISSVEPAISNAKALHDGVALNCFRTIKLDAGTAESSIDLDNVFTTPFSLTMHYQEDQLTSSMKENSVGIFEYKPQANRWSLIGGHVNEQSNEVTAHLAKAGTFGLFYSDKLAVDESEVVSGIILEPNPFSPNGDGLYDETNISFYLTREASVTVEIYNIDGRLCQRLEDTFTFADEDQINGAAHRVEGIIWNGTDDKGDNVPYGVYIMRLLVTYNQGGGRRTIGSNHPVAVIR